METPLPDVIDRISVLRLKMERIGKKEFEDEFNSYQNALKEFEQNGIQINQEWIEKLYEINKKSWDLAALLQAAEKNKNGLEKMGKIHIHRLFLNRKRVAIKNEIADTTGSGSRDIQMN